MAPSLKFSFPPKSELDMQHDDDLSDELVGGEWTKASLYLVFGTSHGEERLRPHSSTLYHHHHHHHRPATGSPSSSNMPLPLNLSQQSWLPRRPSNPSTPSPANVTNASNATLISGHTSTSKLKGKGRSADSNPFGVGSKHGHNVDNLGPSSDSSPSPTTYDSSSHSPPLHPRFQSLPSRHRTSLLSAASDALGFRKKVGSVSRKKPNFHSVRYSSNIMPGVIEINARNNTTVTSTVGGTTAHRDYEYEERERLRDVAAQSIGLGPELLHDSCKSASRSSLDSPQSPPQPARIPPFPATLAALRPFTELSVTLPKFTPPSSLLAYALARQWKPRTIVLTSHSPCRKTHVHLFKGASKDEKELERLEVTEDSVIFVAEEEVGGKGNVVKFAGKDVSAKRIGTLGQENLRTMWFLQITDPTESQRWIAAIKNAVLTQRAVRAGLDIPPHVNKGNEPKGDMDVMLSMHLQGLISTHPTKPSTTISPSPPPTSPSPPPSLRSLRINIPSSPSPTIAMKGIFSGTRPRSPSVEGSSAIACPPGYADDSFGAAGTSLLTMLRTKSSVDSSSSPSHSLPLPLPHVPRKGSPVPSLRSTNAPIVITALDLKISKERDAPGPSTTVPEASSSSTPTDSSTPTTPSLSLQGALTLSLQPPPRKCKHAVAATPATSPHEQQEMYKQASGNHSVAGNFGVSCRGSGDVTPRETSPVSPASSSFSGGQLGSFSSNSGFGAPFPYVGEVYSNGQSDDVTSTLSGSGVINPSSPGVGSIPMDKLLQSAAITKRWSRQGVPLPKQPTPPSGPPPSIPPSLKNNHRTSVESSISIPVTYTVDRSPSSSSSNSQPRARVSSRSGSSLSPTFWKRASGSSAYSASSTSTFDSQGRPQLPVLGGESFHSSLGSVVGNGASSRPLSLSVRGSSPVAHIGAAKRRSMPPPRPAPNFAPPPAPTVHESTSTAAPLTIPASVPQKSFRSSVAQRALRLSLTSPKPPPSSALPPRPDEAAFAQGHRRSSSTGTPDLHPAPVPPSHSTSALSGDSNLIQSTSPLRSLSIRQRLRILSTPPTSLSPVQPHSPLLPSIQVSTLDLSDDDDNLTTPHLQSPQPFGLGEHIITMQNNPSFLQLSTPDTPTIPKPPPRSPFRPVPPSSSTMSGLRTSPFESDRDFVALSPPPRRGSKHHVVTATRPEKHEVERSGSTRREESRLIALSQRGSVVSLGFVTA